LIWSEKIELFTTIAGIRNNAFDENELDPPAIAKRLASRKVTVPNEAELETLKNKNVKHLHAFLDSLEARHAI
jgi:hypothetical protein